MHNPTQVKGEPIGLLPEGLRGYLEVSAGTSLNPRTSPPFLRERREEGQEEEAQAALLGSRSTVDVLCSPYWQVC